MISIHQSLANVCGCLLIAFSSFTVKYGFFLKSGANFRISMAMKHCGTCLCNSNLVVMLKNNNWHS